MPAFSRAFRRRMPVVVSSQPPIRQSAVRLALAPQQVDQVAAVINDQVGVALQGLR